MKRVALIAHCLINQNAKVEGGALTPAVWSRSWRCCESTGG